MIMSDEQKRLDELLALSNEEMDKLAADVQGWARKQEPTSRIAWYVQPNPLDKETHFLKTVVDLWHPSTDLNQAWALCGVSPFSFLWERAPAHLHTDYLELHDHPGGYQRSSGALIGVNCDREGRTPARILTAFGILARELEKQEV